MKKYQLAAIILVSFAVSSLTGISFAKNFDIKGQIETSGPEWVPDEVIVKFKPGVSGEAVNGILQQHGASEIATSRFGGFKRLRIPPGKTVEEMVEIYKKNPNVDYSEPNYIAYAFFVPNDDYFSYQWHMIQIDMEPAWDITAGSGVIVAVIDTGVAYEDYEEPGKPIGNSGKYTVGAVYTIAPDLQGTSFVTGYDFINDDEHPNDDEGHGTHVTGTIAQTTDNVEGVAGIAYHASIMPLKVLDSSGSGTYADIADAIYFAAEKGADVINMSLGGSSGSETLENALANAYSSGVTIVCASGNDGSDTAVSYPAAYDAYCIAVGAVRFDETRSYFSNAGVSLDLTAPGGDTTVDQNGDGYPDGVLQQTFGTDPTDFGYYFYQGTSMAAPHVSGVAALLIASGVATTPAEIREALQVTAMDRGVPGWDSEYGWGIVNAYAALNYTASPNNKPTANPGDQYVGFEDEQVIFDGSGSSDPDGDSLTYTWDFGDGSTGAGVDPRHTYTAGGTYRVTLVVNDGKADSDPATTSAEILEVNDPPVADAGLDQSAAAGSNVSFDGSNSYDPDEADVLTYEWDFGDGSIGSGQTIEYVYSAEGIYDVCLTVSDGHLSDTDCALVTVSNEAVPSLNVGDIEMSIKVAGPNVNAVATVYVLGNDFYSVEGATVYGTWSGLTDDSDSGVTDGNGAVSLSSDKVKNASGTFSFTVTGIVKDGWDSFAGDKSNSIDH